MSKKKQPEQAETEQTEAKQASEEKTEQPAEAKTPAADWEAKYNDLNDRYLRMAAEYDNFRKRSQREREQAYTDAVSAQSPLFCRRMITLSARLRQRPRTLSIKRASR